MLPFGSLTAARRPSLRLFFGNSSDAGFLLLERALPFMAPEVAAERVAEAWMHGAFGENAFQLGARRITRVELAKRAVTLFRASPLLRPVDLPEHVELFRGVL